MRVVHCKREPYTHYIGRPSVFGNPFQLTSEVDRDLVIAKFEEYARDNLDLLMAIADLPEDAVLGCWCYPKACHGNVIIKLWRVLRAA